MDIKNGSRTQAGRRRTVHPLADTELIDPRSTFYDPDFSVTVLEESTTATARRWDDEKWNPNDKKDPRYSEKMMKVSLREVDELVASWTNFVENGVPIVCTPDNRCLLVEVSVPTLDEEQKWKSLWRLTQIALDKQRLEETKNSSSSAPTTSAVA